MIRAKLPGGFFIHWPIYETQLIGADTFSCARWPGGRLANCEINGRRLGPLAFRLELRASRIHSRAYRCYVLPSARISATERHMAPRKTTGRRKSTTKGKRRTPARRRKTT
jgi:hypothetical protein